MLTVQFFVVGVTLHDIHVLLTSGGADDLTEISRKVAELLWSVASMFAFLMKTHANFDVCL